MFSETIMEYIGSRTPDIGKCQTDHKKFSAIGATILMTAFIALCAGTSAAWYFTQKVMIAQEYSAGPWHLDSYGQRLYSV